MNEERKKILKMVEDGLISSDEAAELFESLDKAEQAKRSNEITEQVNWEQGNNYHDQSNKQANHSRKAKFINLLEEAITKIKNVDLDFNFGAYTKVSHVFHIQDADFSKIDVDISNGDIELVTWEESDVRIECEAKVYQVENQDQARNRFLTEAEFDIADSELQLFVPAKQIKLVAKIKVPSKLYQKVALKLFNGSVKVSNAEVNSLRIRTKNGSIDIDHTNGENANLETANGSIKAKQLEFTSIEAETINGSVRTSGTFEKVEAQAVSGGIHCIWNGDQAHTGFFKTATGNIRLAIPDNKQVDGLLSTNIGNIHCHLGEYNVYEEKNELMKKRLHFEANQRIKSLLHIEAETKTGSIWVLPSE